MVVRGGSTNAARGISGGRRDKGVDQGFRNMFPEARRVRGLISRFHGQNLCLRNVMILLFSAQALVWVHERGCRTLTCTTSIGPTSCVCPTLNSRQRNLPSPHINGLGSSACALETKSNEQVPVQCALRPGDGRAISILLLPARRPFPRPAPRLPLPFPPAGKRQVPHRRHHRFRGGWRPVGGHRSADRYSRRRHSHRRRARHRQRHGVQDRLALPVVAPGAGRPLHQGPLPVRDCGERERSRKSGLCFCRPPARRISYMLRPSGLIFRISRMRSDSQNFQLRMSTSRDGNGPRLLMLVSRSSHIYG